MYVEQYFGSRDKFAAMIELYKAKCRGSLESNDSDIFNTPFLSLICIQFIFKMKFFLKLLLFS
jgi:hypothetical protein